MRPCLACFLLLALQVCANEEASRRVQQYERGLTALSAKLIKEMPELQKLNRKLKKRQQAVYIAVQADEQIRALAKLKATDMAKYQREYARVRRKLIQENDELRAHDIRIRRIQGQMKRVLAKHPGVSLLEQRLKDARSKL